MSSSAGIVYLVGAGPGDPGLITVRGREILAAADVVLYDRLVSRELLTVTKPGAELIEVGKAPRGPGVSQEQIHRLLVGRASAGLTVVRLKGGDPLVFGRGFEELRACREANLPCVIIPGVSSATAGPVAAGIPVTARGISDSFAVITAAGADGRAPLHDFKAMRGVDTLIILMGRERLSDVAAELLRAGWPGDTPAACIENATMPAQRTVRAELNSIASTADAAGLSAPLITVVGAVAWEASESPWLDALPLSGKRILLTRPTASGGGMESALGALGAVVFCCPLLEIEVTPPPVSASEIFRRPVDWVVFTSQHGVAGFFAALEAEGRDARLLAQCKIAAVGPQTARALEACRLKPDFLPSTFSSEALARQLLASTGGKPGHVVFPCGDQALDLLPRLLAPAEVTPLVVYRTTFRPPPPMMRREIERGLFAIVFCSPSAVRGFKEAQLPTGEAMLACLGETTASEARRLGLTVDAVASQHTVEALVEALLACRSSAPTVT